MWDDKTLIISVARGNEAAFRVLFDRHREPVYQFLLKVTRSKELSEEMLLDIFVRIWVNRASLVSVESLEAYLRTSATHKAIDYFRREARERKQHARLYRVISSEASLQESHCDSMDALETADVWEKALAELTPQRRLIFSMSRHDGLSHEEISRQLSLSRNTVRNTVAGSLRIIRKYFQEQGMRLLLAAGFFLFS